MMVKGKAGGRLTDRADHTGDDRILKELARQAILQSIYARVYSSSKGREIIPAISSGENPSKPSTKYPPQRFLSPLLNRGRSAPDRVVAKLILTVSSASLGRSGLDHREVLSRDKIWGHNTTLM